MRRFKILHEKNRIGQILTECENERITKDFHAVLFETSKTFWDIYPVTKKPTDSLKKVEINKSKSGFWKSKKSKSVVRPRSIIFSWLFFSIYEYHFIKNYMEIVILIRFPNPLYSHSSVSKTYRSIGVQN